MTNWKEYGPCERCVVDARHPCLNVRTYQDLESPHSGRKTLVPRPKPVSHWMTACAACGHIKSCHHATMSRNHRGRLKMSALAHCCVRVCIEHGVVRCKDEECVHYYDDTRVCGCEHYVAPVQVQPVTERTER